jgi:hypothetical protein
MILVVMYLCVPQVARANTLDAVILPGMDFRDAELSAGKWCRYLVIDEALGQVDTASVYIAILGSDGNDDYWIEVASGPMGGGGETRDVTRLLISAGIKDFHDGDSLYPYVKRMYIRRGATPVESGDPRDLEHLTLSSPTSETDWIRTPDESLVTPAGTLVCERKELTVEDSQDIPSGKITIIRRNVDHLSVWSSDRVPIFQLVKCVIERSRESKTVPVVRGIPQTGPKLSRTTTVLTDFGDDASPLINID